MTAKETAGRDGRGEDGRAGTREVELAVFVTQDKPGSKGYRVRDQDCSATRRLSSPPPCSPAWFRQKASAAAPGTSGR